MTRIGIVVIGRNEDERLERCLHSLAGSERTIVYVDSGSTDGSVAFARDERCSVVELDLSRPFSAARARNEGLRRLIEEDPTAEFVQFVDGDCEVDQEWMEKALETLRASPQAAIVCGRRRERHPDASPYNRMCDIEWDTPVGEAQACGGDFLARIGALIQVGGFDPSVVAGEEPELCLRLRREKWTILRIDAEMTVHDAAITSFGQWWRRAVRGGHAYAQATALHGRFCLRENSSIVFWSAAWPLASLGLTLPTRGWSLLMLAAYPLQIVRIAWRERRRVPRAADAWLYALFCVLGKWPQHVGQWKYLLDRWHGRLPKIIEYKDLP